LGDSKAESRRAAEIRDAIARQFTRVEDVVYIGLGILLAGCAVSLLISAGIDFVSSIAGRAFPDRVVEILDRILLVLLIVEILYTVQVSFREHALMPEPFLIVGLIAGIRRVLVLTAELKDLMKAGDEAFRNGMYELGLLALLIVAMVASLMMLRRGSGSAPRSEAQRAV
jgi:uncharacterized membrane protein (DUF373 family)